MSKFDQARGQRLDALMLIGEGRSLDREQASHDQHALNKSLHLFLRPIDMIDRPHSSTRLSDDWAQIGRQLG